MNSDDWAVIGDKAAVLLCVVVMVLIACGVIR